MKLHKRFFFSFLIYTISNINVSVIILYKDEIIIGGIYHENRCTKRNQK